jgi:hypothetical protein
MLYGVYLYYCCNSFTRASRALEPFVRRSSVAIWSWLQRLALICDRFDVDGSMVSCIYVDETMVYVNQGSTGVDMGRVRTREEALPGLQGELSRQHDRRVRVP